MNRSNIFFSSFSQDELEAIWKRVRAIRPYLLHAHPSTVDQLAAHVERTRGREKAFEVFESSGELLQPHQRARIGRVLQCHVVDRYGLAEAGVVAYQLSVDSPCMRFYEFFAWPEIRPDENDDSGTATENAGELVITPLMNTLMPLLRYRTGDKAVLVEDDQGLAVPWMVGRIHDVVMIAGKPLPTHYVQDVLDRVGGVREFQIDVGGSKPVLRLVPEEGCDTAGIVERVASWWGDSVTVEFIAPSELKLVGARQKFRHLVSS
jgi:phenylacetate-CoA ligase